MQQTLNAIALALAVVLSACGGGGADNQETVLATSKKATETVIANATVGQPTAYSPEVQAALVANKAQADSRSLVIDQAILVPNQAILVPNQAILVPNQAILVPN